MKRNDGKDYELVTRAIFQALVNQTQAQNINVQHNISLRGKIVEHQIDVYWEFSLAGFTYKTVVECKDWGTSKLKQETVFAFKQKLEDLNNPLGVMVTQIGYQAGALRYAQTHGILLYQLFEEPAAEPLVVKEGSFGTFHLHLPDWVMEYVYYETAYKNISFVIDGTWIQQEEKRLGTQLQPDIRNLSFPPRRPAAVKLYNEKGEECGNILKILLPLAEAISSTQEAGRKRYKHSFASPTFLKIDLPHLPYLKIVSVSSDIVITKHPPLHRPMQLEGFVSFILNNLQDGTTQRIRVKEPNRL